jgi:hypothetical protein
MENFGYLELEHKPLAFPDLAGPLLELLVLALR